MVGRADHVARELVADGEHELQVGDGLRGVPGPGRQRRESQAAVVLRRPEVPAGRVVQPVPMYPVIVVDGKRLTSDI